MKLSLLFGKKTISEGGKEGYVIGVTATGVALGCLVCADGNEREFYVPFKNVKSVKTKIVYSESGKADGEPVRLGKPVFDCGGTYLGKLTDFICESGKLCFACVGNKKISADDIVCGDAVIVKNSARILKSDVKKGRKIILKRGTSLTPEALEKARVCGEYVQANLKSI